MTETEVANWLRNLATEKMERALVEKNKAEDLMDKGERSEGWEVDRRLNWSRTLMSHADALKQAADIVVHKTRDVS